MTNQANKPEAATLPSRSGDRPEFDEFASSYAALLDDPLRNRFTQDPLHFHHRKWWTMQALFRRYGIAPARQRWLDVGCGQGELLSIAGSSFLSAQGCDLSAGMLKSATAFRTLRQPSPTELPFENGSMDLVTAVCVYHHVHGQARTQLTEEIRRVLVPGGRCCIVEHNPWNPVTRTIVARSPVDVDAELLTADQTRGLFEAGGFDPVCTDYFLYLPERLFAKLGRLESWFAKVPLGGQYIFFAQKV